MGCLLCFGFFVLYLCWGVCFVYMIIVVFNDGFLIMFLFGIYLVVLVIIWFLGVWVCLVYLCCYVCLLCVVLFYGVLVVDLILLRLLFWLTCLCYLLLFTYFMFFDGWCVLFNCLLLDGVYCWCVFVDLITCGFVICCLIGGVYWCDLFCLLFWIVYVVWFVWLVVAYWS